MGDVQKLQDEQLKVRALKSLQDAARNKDKDPETFEAARLRYNFLTKGPAWLEQEKQRLSSEKLDPILGEYRDIYSSLQNEADVQRAYTDSIETIRNKQSDLTSSAKTQTSYFQKLLDQEKQKKSAFDRFIELTSPAYAVKNEPVQDVPFVVRYFSSFPASFRIIMDVILGVIIAIILVLAVSKVRRSGFRGSFMAFRPQQGSINIFQTPVPSSFGRSA